MNFTVYPPPSSYFVFEKKKHFWNSNLQPLVLTHSSNAISQTAESALLSWTHKADDLAVL